MKNQLNASNEILALAIAVAVIAIAIALVYEYESKPETPVESEYQEIICCH